MKLRARERRIQSRQKTKGPQWREQNAYTLGVQAYIYCFPWAYLPDARWTRTAETNRQADAFVHVRKLKGAKHLSGRAPNNDTLYCRTWVFLNDQPVILSVPEINDRYYTMEIVDFMGDNFACVGARATGTRAGSYTIIGSVGSLRFRTTTGSRLFLEIRMFATQLFYGLSGEIHRV